MGRPRIRLRKSILVVAAAAVIFGGEQCRRRREYCLRRSLVHRTSLMPWNGSHFQTPLLSAEDERKIAGYSPHARWHLGLAAEYRRVASHPWESLPIEPEEPIDFLIPREQQTPGHRR